MGEKFAWHYINFTLCITILQPIQQTFQELWAMWLHLYEFMQVIVLVYILTAPFFCA
jgi:hypothetical protein